MIPSGVTDAILNLVAQAGSQGSGSQLARGWFALLGLAIAAIVLVVGLLVLTSLRRSGRAKAPTKTPHVDAWAEAGKRAPATPSASDILDGDGDDHDDD